MHISETRHTARFVCTTDSTMAQIASFYAGAMSEARQIELAPIVDAGRRARRTSSSVPTTPTGCCRHTEECRQRGYRVRRRPVASSSPSVSGDLIRELIDGATILFSNEYEVALIEQKTGWSSEEILGRVGTRVTTLGARASGSPRAGEPDIELPAARKMTAVEPDRRRRRLPGRLPRRAGLGPRASSVPPRWAALLAAYVVETVGTQEYAFTPAQFLARLEDSYGADAAADVAPHLGAVRR